MKYPPNPLGHTSKPKRISKRYKGQGLTEYIIIVALIAIAAVGAVSFFGSSVKASFLAMGSELVGAEEVDMVATTQTNLDKAKGDAEAQITLETYRN